MFEATKQGGEAQDAVDIEHDGRIDRVAHERRRGLAGHHDRQHDDLDKDCRERQDHRAIGIADLGRQHLGMVRHAQRGEHDRHHETGGTEKRCQAPHFQKLMLQRDPGNRGSEGSEQQTLRSHPRQQNVPSGESLPCPSSEL